VGSEGAGRLDAALILAPDGTRFGTRFSRQERAPTQENSGTDARFPSENRQSVVVRESPEPNGVQGVAGSNPAVPIDVTEKADTHLECRPFGVFGVRATSLLRSGPKTSRITVPRGIRFLRFTDPPISFSAVLDPFQVPQFVEDPLTVLAGRIDER
jgi:hypothetical protein